MPETMDYVLMGLGVLGAVIIASKVPTVVKAAGKSLSLDSSKLSTIPGIDIDSLNTIKYAGIM